MVALLHFTKMCAVFVLAIMASFIIFCFCESFSVYLFYFIYLCAFSTKVKLNLI